ncbi:unnamed protein product, partial [Staurois parvus]
MITYCPGPYELSVRPWVQLSTLCGSRWHQGPHQSVSFYQLSPPVSPYTSGAPFKLALYIRVHIRVSLLHYGLNKSTPLHQGPHHSPPLLQDTHQSVPLLQHLHQSSPLHQGPHQSAPLHQDPHQSAPLHQ